MAKGSRVSLFVNLFTLGRWGTGIVGLILLGNSLVFGQGFSAAMSGSVRDSSGAVIPQATVTARNIETGQTRVAETGAGGNYNLQALPVGPYELTVEKPGFRQLVRSGINLTVGREAVLNLTLEVGNVTQTVEVTGEAPLVNTTLSPTSGLINEGQIKDLPLNGRSFDQLLTLNVGTVNNVSNSGWGSSFSVAGKRLETNRFTINGVDYVGDNPTGQFNAPSGTSGQLLGVDAVREYNVVGHTYGAEYGKRAGGQITVVTTSGTNQLHGTVFEYLRNNKLDARNFFTEGEGAPPFKRNQFGLSLGGPIKRDKMFVFGNYEGFRERLAVDTVGAVPNAQARQGLLPCNVVYPSGAAGSAAQSARDANCGTSLAGLNAYVNVPNLVPGILPFMRYWPEANGIDQADANGLLSGGAFSSTAPGRKPTEDFGSGRFDYNMSNADSVSANFTVDRGAIANPTENPIIIQNDTQNLYALSGQETHIFSPTMLGIGTFGYSHASSDRQAISDEPFPENLLLMAGEGRNNPGAFTLGGGSGTAQAAAFMVANGANLLYNNRDIFSGSYDMSITRGIHNLKMGVWAQKIKQTSFSSGQNNAGTAQFAGLLTFLRDIPTTFSAAPNPIELQYRSSEAAWYFQDEIKLRPNLTVRLGLRDEMTTGWNEANGRASNYLADPSGTILTNPLVGKSALIENNAIALWQPRVGVAWDPTGTGSWAVRAGFGIHNDLQDNLGQRLSANPPFAGRVQFSNVPLLGNATSPRIIPIASTEAPPPQCQTAAEQTAARTNPRLCASYAPGGIDPVMHTPTIQQWSLEIERAITDDLAFTIGYVGSESYHTNVGVDMNSKKPVVCEDAAGCRGGTVPKGHDYTPPGLSRPNPLVSSTQGWFMFGTSSYHALNLSLTKRSRGGLMFKTNFSWAKVLDLDSGLLTTSAMNEPSTIVTRFKPSLSHGITSYSLLHQFNTNVSYELPFGRGKAIGGGATGVVDGIIGGWQLNSIFNAQGGFPITPLAGQNRSDNGDSRNSDTPNFNPAFTGNPILGVDSFKKTGFYLDTDAFELPPLGMYGNVARGSFRGPGLVNVDLSLFKRIPLTERWNLQFRAEAFNILNHANFATPDTTIFTGTNVSGNAGRILDTSNRERQIQFALRLEF